jgi:hypothetical protein
MTNFTTTIDAMYTVPASNSDYVISAIFTVTGVDGNNSFSIGSNLQFSLTDEVKDFIPYTNLTEATVLGWVEASGQLPALQASIQNQIDALNTPVVAPQNKPLPWVA